MVRKQGHTLSNTFRLKVEAETWAAEQESRIGRGEKPSTKPITSRETLGVLIDLHLEDLKELGTDIGRSKEQGEWTGRAQGFIFPYDGRSVGAAFQCLCRDLANEDLHFHELRHEAISRE